MKLLSAPPRSHRFPLGKLPTLCFLSAFFLQQATLTAAEETPSKANLHVLSIGVEPDLSKKGENDPYALDAKHIATSLEAAKSLYASVKSRVLAGNEADKTAVLAALEEMKKTMRDGDVALIHFSTHGDIVEEKGFIFSLALSKRNKDKPDLTGDEFNKIIKDMKGTVLVSLDTCCAAGVFPKIKLPNVSYLVASGRDESSSGDGDSTESPHGYYIQVFVKALQGSADANTDRRVTFGELAAYLPAQAALLYSEQNAESQINDAHRNISLTIINKQTPP